MFRDPIEILCDCAFVVEGVQDILDGRGYGTRDHADLWQLLAEALAAKDEDFLLITKVKAHTTETDLAEGPTNPELKRFNDAVDLEAKAGARMNQVSPRLVAAAIRRKRVTLLIQRMILAVLAQREPLYDEWRKKCAAQAKQ